jgi:hypothetical protein
VTEEAPAFTFLSVEDALSLHEDAINNGIELQAREEGGESVLARAMIDVAERRWPEPRKALAAILRGRHPSGAAL